MQKLTYTDIIAWLTQIEVMEKIFASSKTVESPYAKGHRKRHFC